MARSRRRTRSSRSKGGSKRRNSKRSKKCKAAKPASTLQPTRRSWQSATFAADMATYSELNFPYLFYSATNLASVSGLGNLSGVRSMRFMFSPCAFTELDFRGFDPSDLTDLYYAFSGCSSLVTIYVDSTWALPSSGVSGSNCFYTCNSLIGGAGTTWASSATGYQYMRIDAAGTPGYLTAA